jgi:hypothetical protein
MAYSCGSPHLMLTFKNFAVNKIDDVVAYASKHNIHNIMFRAKLNYDQQLAIRIMPGKIVAQDAAGDITDAANPLAAFATTLVKSATCLDTIVLYGEWGGSQFAVGCVLLVGTDEMIDDPTSIAEIIESCLLPNTNLHVMPWASNHRVVNLQDLSEVYEYVTILQSSIAKISTANHTQISAMVYPHKNSTSIDVIDKNLVFKLFAETALPVVVQSRLDCPVYETETTDTLSAKTKSEIAILSYEKYGLTINQRLKKNQMITEFLTIQNND